MKRVEQIEVLLSQLRTAWHQADDCSRRASGMTTPEYIELMNERASALRREAARIEGQIIAAVTE